MSNVNIYQMYVANANKAGFYVVRNSWGNTVARITKIGGKTEGELEGNPPYFKNQIVKADIYKRDTGELIESGATISCPGTYGYALIDDHLKKIR
jgi:hypothetical protein